MPLVRLTGAYSRDALGAAGAALHDAMVATLNVPRDDVFRIYHVMTDDGLEADPGFLNIRRDRPLFVEVTLRAGRSDDQKRAFYAQAAHGIAQRAGVAPGEILIVLRENGPADWSFGNGIAQYAQG